MLPVTHKGLNGPVLQHARPRWLTPFTGIKMLQPLSLPVHSPLSAAVSLFFANMAVLFP